MTMRRTWVTWAAILIASSAEPALAAPSSGSLNSAPAAVSQDAQAKTKWRQLINRGNEALRAGNLKEAHPAFEQARILVPRDEQALAGLGAIALLEGRPQEAIGLFRQALEIKPTDADLELLLGRAYLDARLLQDAESTLSRLYSRLPAKPNVGFYLGITLERLGKYREALQPLRRGPFTAAKFSAAARLHCGLCLRALGNAEEARKELSQFLTATPPPAIAAVVQKVIDSPARRAAAPKRLQGTARLGLQRDDNVVLAPTSNVFGLRNQTLGSLGMVGRADLTYDLVSRSHQTLSAGYDGFATLNFDRNDKNLQSHGLNLSWQERDLGPGRRFRLDAQSYFETVLSGERAFLERFIASAFLTRSHGSRASTALAMRYQSKHFDDQGPLLATAEDRNADNIAFGATYRFSAKKKPFSAFVRYEFDSEAARGANLDYSGNRIGAGIVTRLLSEKTFFSAGLEYHLRDYHNVHSFFLVRRDDDEAFSYANVSHRLDDRKSLSLEFFRDRNRSNIPFFDFERNIVTTALTVRF